MILNKSIRVALASFLLLCFSVVALPLDFFHNHEAEEVSCNPSSKHSTCQHKVHISKKAAYCFVCTIHFDKNFVIESPARQFLSTASVNPVSLLILPFYEAAAIVPSLRGPPSF